MIIVNDSITLDSFDELYTHIKELNIWEYIDYNNKLIEPALLKVLEENCEESIFIGEHILKIIKQPETGNKIKNTILEFKVYLKFDSIRKKVHVTTDSITLTRIVN